jgi:diaminopropionate ammonia-lyase
MAAAVTQYRLDGNEPLIVGVEPLDANCVQASALAGEISHVPGPHESIMVGLNCGTASLTAWPRVSAGVDWFVSVDDDMARQAMRDLAAVRHTGMRRDSASAASSPTMVVLLIRASPSMKMTCPALPAAVSWRTRPSRPWVSARRSPASSDTVRG